MSFIRFWNFNGHGYGLFVNNLNWANARSSALSSGGYLAEVNDVGENNFIKTILNDELSSLSSDSSFDYKDTSLTFLYEDTVAPDGGGAAYVWLGGTDESIEGSWIWDKSGQAISTGRDEWGSGTLGSEPDNFNGNQDHLAFGLENWPAGSSPAGFGEYGQWNDINGSNNLFSLVEFDFQVDEKSGSRINVPDATDAYEEPVYKRYLQFGDAKICTDKIYPYGSSQYSALIPSLEFDSLIKADIKFELDSHQLVSSYSTSYILDGVSVVDELREVTLGSFDFSPEGKMTSAAFTERSRWLWSQETTVATGETTVTEDIKHWTLSSPFQLSDATNRGMWDVASEAIQAGNVVVDTYVEDSVEDPITGNVNSFLSGNMSKFYGAGWQDGTLSEDKLLDLNKVYRLFNQPLGRHLFSMNVQEVDILTGSGWVNEGVAYFSPTEPTAEVYRFYVQGENRHFYTANTDEKDAIIASSDLSHYAYEGIAYKAYSHDDKPENCVAVVRFYNTNTGSHLYSTSSYEQSLLADDPSWVNEGIAWYGDAV